MVVIQPAKQMRPYGAELVHAQLYIDCIGGGSSVRGLEGINHSSIHPTIFRFPFLTLKDLFNNNHITEGGDNKGNTGQTTKTQLRVR